MQIPIKYVKNNTTSDENDNASQNTRLQRWENADLIYKNENDGKYDLYNFTFFNDKTKQTTNDSETERLNV